MPRKRNSLIHSRDRRVVPPETGVGATSTCCPPPASCINAIGGSSDDWALPILLTDWCFGDGRMLVGGRYDGWCWAASARGPPGARDSRVMNNSKAGQLVHHDHC